MSGHRFETKVCSRCGGSGKFSFNVVNGDTCFGCNGSGKKLTSKGQAAYNYFKAQLKKPAIEVKLGDIIEFDMFFFKCFSKVTAIELDTSRGDGHFYLKGIRAKTQEEIAIGCCPNSVVRLSFSEEQKKALLEKAYAYQETLRKDGKPRSRHQTKND